MARVMTMGKMMTGVSQSHYFQTEKICLPLARELLLRTTRLRVGTMTMPAMEAGKTLRTRKMSEN